MLDLVANIERINKSFENAHKNNYKILPYQYHKYELFKWQVEFKRSEYFRNLESVNFENIWDLFEYSYSSLGHYIEISWQNDEVGINQG